MKKRLISSLFILLTSCSSMHTHHFNPSLSQYAELKTLINNDPAMQFQTQKNAAEIKIAIKDMFYDERYVPTKQNELFINKLSKVLKEHPEVMVEVHTFNPPNNGETIDMLTDSMAAALFHSLRKAGVEEEQISIQNFEPGCPIEDLVVDMGCYMDQQIVFRLSESDYARG